MKKLFNILFALVLVVGLGLAITAPVAAEPGATYYVSATGDDDTGDGTVGNPWRTIQKAIGALNFTEDGDTIMVAAGEYDAFLVADKANIDIISTEGATITTASLHWIEEGPIEDAWVMAGMYRSENINIQGINFDGTAISQEAVIGIVYVDSTGSIAGLTLENILGTDVGTGVAIIDKEGTSTVEIKGCTISNNDVGIGTLSDSTQEARFNNIVGNTDYGVWNYGGEMVDAIYNWWGDDSGPYHPITNPGGSGNPVSNDVDFDPWLEAASVTQTIVGGGTINALAAADIIVEVTGTATVVIYKYDSNPHPDALVDGGGTTVDPLQDEVWIDLNKWLEVKPIYYESDTELRIELYYKDSELAQAADDAGHEINENSLRLRWYDPAEGKPVDCVPPGDVEPAAISIGEHDYSGYMWVELTADGTYPTLAEAQASIETFGGYGHPSEDPNGGCGMATLADVTPFALVSVGIVAVWATKRKGKVS